MLPPILQATRAAGEPAPAPVIPPPEDERSYPIVGIVDSGITNIPAIEAWSAGSADFLDMAGQDVSHGTFIAGLVCASDALNQDAIFAEGRCRFFDLGLHPTAAGAYENYYPRGFIDFLEQLDAEIPTAKEQGVRIFNMSLAVTTPVQHDGYSVFANMLDEIADKHDILFVLPSGNLIGRWRDRNGHLSRMTRWRCLPVIAFRAKTESFSQPIAFAHWLLGLLIQETGMENSCLRNTLGGGRDRRLV